MPENFEGQNQEKNNLEEEKIEKLEEMDLEKQIMEVYKTTHLVNLISAYFSQDERRKKWAGDWLDKHGEVLDSVKNLNREGISEIDQAHEKINSPTQQSMEDEEKDKWSTWIGHVGLNLWQGIQARREMEKQGDSPDDRFVKSYQRMLSNWKYLIKQCEWWDELNKAHEILEEPLSHYPW